MLAWTLCGAARALTALHWPWLALTEPGKGVLDVVLIEDIRGQKIHKEAAAEVLASPGETGPRQAAPPAFWRSTCGYGTESSCPGVEAGSWHWETVLRTAQDSLPRWKIPQVQSESESHLLWLCPLGPGTGGGRSPGPNFWATHRVFGIRVF